jgi:small-conductance mechanosensitive channel
MIWYNYVALFFAGAFLANSVPHFVKGISGDKFPTPFAKPPGKGLSSPLTNVLWSLLNIVVGVVLLFAGLVGPTSIADLIAIFAGVALFGVMLSIRFEQKDKE